MNLRSLGFILIVWPERHDRLWSARESRARLLRAATKEQFG